MSITDNIIKLRATIPANVKLVAVSKFHNYDSIMEAYEAGQRIFGESRVQELMEKHPKLPKDIEWHFVGSLQRNKVKQIMPIIALIHSVDSEKLLCEINKRAAAVNRVIPCLLQLHIAKETTKSGFTYDECRAFLDAGGWKNLEHVQIVGVMGMATLTDDSRQVHKEFRGLELFFEECKQTWFDSDDRFKEVSMGMSHDYPIAIEEGSTMIRIGTMIFGPRNY